MVLSRGVPLYLHTVNELFNHISNYLLQVKMRKILLLIATMFTVMCASASDVEKIQFANAGKFSLGVMSGFPRFEGSMPIISLDGMIGLKDGFCHTNKFGDNGAIDLGFYIGYGRDESKISYLVDPENPLSTNWQTGNITSWVMPATLRSAFHWEFVKNLDVYFGLQAGVSYYSRKTTDHEGNQMSLDNGLGILFGHYLGAKWMFSKHFGVKAEYNGGRHCFGNSKYKSELPIGSVGFQFNF